MNQSVTLAFDVYGTLIDTHGVATILQSMVGDKAHAVSQTWRDKQLEYSFRRGLMQHYENFAVCTRQALEFTCQFHQLDLSETQKSKLIESYKTLPAFRDVQAGLSSLKETNAKLFAFSNGSRAAVETLLDSAGIREHFDGVVSCDDIKSFKPNPAVYAHFLRESGAQCSEAWLVSSNPFDVIGALSSGMRSAWVQRSPEAIFDPWEIAPTQIISQLTELHRAIS